MKWKTKQAEQELMLLKQRYFSKFSYRVKRGWLWDTVTLVGDSWYITLICRYMDTWYSI
jgi:hypothetical protein